MSNEREWGRIQSGTKSDFKHPNLRRLLNGKAARAHKGLRAGDTGTIRDTTDGLLVEWKDGSTDAFAKVAHNVEFECDPSGASASTDNAVGHAILAVLENQWAAERQAKEAKANRIAELQAAGRSVRGGHYEAPTTSTPTPGAAPAASQQPPVVPRGPAVIQHQGRPGQGGSNRRTASARSHYSACCHLTSSNRCDLAGLRSTPKADVPLGIPSGDAVSVIERVQITRAAS